MSGAEDNKENMGSVADVKTLDMMVDGYQSGDDGDYNPLEESNVEAASDEDMDITSSSVNIVVSDEEVIDVFKGLTDEEKQDISERYPEVAEQIRNAPLDEETSGDNVGGNIGDVDMNGYDSSADNDYTPLDNTATDDDAAATDEDDDADMSHISDTEVEDMHHPVTPNEAKGSSSLKWKLRSVGAAETNSTEDCLDKAIENYDSNADEDYAEETAESDDSISGEENEDSMIIAEEAKSLQEEVTDMGVDLQTSGSFIARGGRRTDN